MWDTCYRKHTCTNRGKKENRRNTRKPEVFKRKGRVIRGEHRIIKGSPAVKNACSGDVTKEFP
jgi:hypothetical protein